MNVRSSHRRQRSARTTSVRVAAEEHSGGRLEALARFVTHPIAASLAALLVYATVTAAKGDLLASSNYNYFPYLADALLHGQLHLRLLPPSTHDLSLFGGRYYLYWPPMPAVLAIPLVWVWGVGISDFLANNIVAAANVGLVAAVIRAGRHQRLFQLSDLDVALVVIFFAFGTPHFVLATGGGVWYTGQLVCICAMGVLYLASISASGAVGFLCAGVGAAAVLMTRSHAVLVAIWPAFYLLRCHANKGPLFLLRACLIGFAPVLCAVICLGTYNYLRFGSVLDVGVTYHLMDPHFRAGFEEYGILSVHYVPHNLFYHFIAYPLPLGPDSLEGGSLFLMSPLFVAMLWAFRRPTALIWMLLATCVVTYIPIALLLGTGWQQWGPRYLLDFSLPMLLLTAIGVGRWPVLVTVALVIISIVHFSIGVALRY